MQEYDAIVVGAGPIGGFIADKIAEKRYNVAIFEKKKEIGMPMNCAGLVTSRVFENFSISKKDIVQNNIKGAHIHSPSGNVLTVGGDKVHALVIDRALFDKKIVEKAKNADVFLGNKVEKISHKQNGLEIKASTNQRFFTKLLIGADGPFSIVRKTFQLSEPKEFLYGAGAELTNTNLEPDFVHIFIGNKVAPGFFAWIIPTNKEGTNARIGLCTDKKSELQPKSYLDNLFKNKEMSTLVKDVKIKQKTGGVIPLGVVKKPFTDNVMLSGDAAAHVKPTSGGGIYPGLSCASFCSDIAVEAIKNNDFSSSLLKKYQKLCMDNIGKELVKAYRFRYIYKKLSDKQLDKYTVKFSDPRITETINKYGDIDFPSKLVKPLIKKTPFLLKFLPSSLK